LEKRKATVEMEANAAHFASLPFVQSKEFTDLKGHLSSSGKTLYDLENDLVAQIESGKL
jgi:hypothetical protein